MTNEFIGGIRKVTNGYIVEAKWPYGGEVLGFGEVICKDLKEVLLFVLRCANDGDNIREIDELKKLLLLDTPKLSEKIDDEKLTFEPVDPF